MNYGRVILRLYPQQGDILFVPEARLGFADESQTVTERGSVIDNIYDMTHATRIDVRM